MLQCQNCGQANNYQSNFCRFCGTRMVMPQNANPVSEEYIQPPRPYMWKTDEFQINDNSSRKTQNINQVLPIPPPRPMNPQYTPQMMAPRPAYPMMTGYQCPQCGTPHFPRIVKKISTAGWIVFAVLLVFFFPFFWIGLLIKDEVRVCPICNYRAG